MEHLWERKFMFCLRQENDFSLLGALENQGMVSQSNQVELYVAKSLTGLTLGAVHLTDNSSSHFLLIFTKYI